MIKKIIIRGILIYLVVLGACIFVFFLEVSGILPSAPGFYIPGWGEDTSALIQAARTDPFLKQALHQTYTSYTGVGIERPFLTPLINLKKIKSDQHHGQLRKIRYFLAEMVAADQNPTLKKILDTALQTEGGIVWERVCYNGSTTSYLIDLYAVGIMDLERVLIIKQRPSYEGEWSF